MAALTSTGPIIRRVYGVEQNNDCDVVFFASDNWRLPAHSDVLKESNVVFRSMFSGEYNHPTEDGTGFIRVEVNDVDGRALDNLLRCLYGYPVPVQSIETALYTLYAAHKYQCPELVNLCISFLTFHLKDTNVLTVLKYARLLAVDYQAVDHVSVEKKIEKPKRRGTKTKSRPKRQVPSPLPLSRKRRPFDGKGPLMEDEVRASAPLLTSDLDTIETACSDLLKLCLALIDSHAVQILSSDELEELDLDTLTLICSRDTLNVQDEVKVFEALDRWAEQQCKQQQLPLTVGSKRKVLKDSIFLPRYLTMTLKTWQNGPLKSGIFAPEEVDIIERLLTGKVNLTQVTSQAPLFTSSMLPRRPIIPQNESTNRVKGIGIGGIRPRRRRFSIFCRFFHFQHVKCCKKDANSQDSSPFSSAPASPVRENQSSPPAPQPNNANGPRRDSTQTARINFLEQMIVCFACLFD